MSNEKMFLKDVNTSKAERTIHSVIFFMPYNIEDNPKFTDALSENFLYSRDNKMNPIVVVTRASMEGGSMAQEYLRLKIAEKFTLPAGSIFMYDNYTKEEDKTMSIDRKTLQILNHTINSSISYQKFYKSTLLDILYSEKKNSCKTEPWFWFIETFTSLCIIRLCNTETYTSLCIIETFTIWIIESSPEPFTSGWIKMFSLPRRS
jgi:hypothetical protein